MILLVLVAQNERIDLSTSAMTEAARQTLGEATVVLVEERATLPNDPDALALASTVHATAVVELGWRDTEHRRLRLHLHAGDPSWIDRDVAFGERDPPSERGRTLGFAVGSMLVDRPEAPHPTPAPPPAPAPTRTAAPPPERAAVAAPAAERREAVAFDIVAEGALGLGGDAGGMGAALSTRLRVARAPSLSLRLGLAMRLGRVTEVSATSTWIAPVGGLAWRAYGSGGAHAVDLGLRADLLIGHFEVDRQGTGRARWVPGADVCAEAAWFFLPPIGFVLSAGIEAAFGSTEVLVNGTALATAPPFRAVSEAGLRWSY
jgi:hypothetical protein